MARAKKARPAKARKDPHAVALGRKGGLASAASWDERTTPEQRRAWGRMGAKARWARVKAKRKGKADT